MTTLRHLNHDDCFSGFSSRFEFRMESAVEVERGTAAIKEQYAYKYILCSDYDYINNSISLQDSNTQTSAFLRFLTTKETFHAFLESGRPGQKSEEAERDSGEPEQKRIRLDSDGAQEEPDKKEKKKKMRGQNKSRPHMKPQSYEDRRLCPSIIQVLI